jgi:hypothetical protein
MPCEPRAWVTLVTLEVAGESVGVVSSFGSAGLDESFESTSGLLDEVAVGLVAVAVVGESGCVGD